MPEKDGVVPLKSGTATTRLTQNKTKGKSLERYRQGISNKVALIPKDKTKLERLRDFYRSLVHQKCPIDVFLLKTLFSDNGFVSTRGIDSNLNNDLQEMPGQEECLMGLSYLLLTTAGLSEFYRVLVIPNEETMFEQKNLNYSVFNRLRPHKSAFGFAKNKKAIECAQHHLVTSKDGTKTEAPELLIKIDLKNFFNSITRSMLEKALIGHKLDKDLSSNYANVCTVDMFSDETGENIIQGLIEVAYNKKKSPPSQPTSQVTTEIDRYFVNNLSQYAMLITKYIDGKTSDRDRFIKSIAFDSCQRIIKVLIRILPSLDTRRPSSAMRRVLQGLMTKHSLKIQKKITDISISEILLCMIYGFVCMSLKINGIHSNEIRDKNTMLYQGGPSSPAASNLVFKLLDYRFDGLAKKCNGTYGRYADDLQFSFPERKTTKSINMFISFVKKILRENGYAVNERKTVVAGKGGRMKVIGYNINSGKPTIDRRYRKNVQNLIKNNNQGFKNYFADQQKIQGMIAYISTAHPAFATKLQDKDKQRTVTRRIII